MSGCTQAGSGGGRQGGHGAKGGSGPPPAPAVRTSTMRGFALPSWYRTDYDSPAAGRYLRDIRATGARWVALTPTWYQNHAADSAPHATQETASDASLRHIVRRAHAAGLKVMIKPHIDLPGDEDRAAIRPRDRAAWFAAYRSFITHYADLAAGTGAEQFSVGTELAGVSGDTAAWTEVVAAVRDHYSGPLTYAANYDEYERIHFWKELDLIGIDAYWPLSARPTDDPARLRAAWQPIREHLAAYARRQGRRILFTEAGYVSQRGATTAPYSWTVSRRSGDAEQAAAYRALLDSFEDRPWWAGVCWWMWDDWPDSGETPPTLAYSPHGKPAERVLREKWAP
ncbi:glycoside hydrolase family 113 [Streptomyces sp. NPDC020801]|uniref:glycoside hydrolase family 113 n=1 Tax=unclassified Streptomyces TaxID=2593676 RepID=UPI003788BC5B